MNDSQTNNLMKFSIVFVFVIKEWHFIINSLRLFILLMAAENNSSAHSFHKR